MTPATLLSDLTARGVEFRAQGDKLRFCPVERLTADEVEAVRGYKAEIIVLLSRPIMQAPATFAPLDPSDPRSWGPPPLVRLTGLCCPIPDDRRLKIGDIYPAADPRPMTTYDRCQSEKYVDVPIHDSASTRRDCRRCHRFMGFPKWYERRMDEETREERCSRLLGRQSGDIF